MTQIMVNQMEKTMENEMKAACCLGSRDVTPILENKRENHMEHDIYRLLGL